MKILLVDDADLFRQSVTNLLRIRGHEVIEATNGLEGLKLARAHLPDVIEIGRASCRERVLYTV